MESKEKLFQYNDNEKVENIDKKINLQAWDSIKGLFFEWFVIMVFIDCFYSIQRSLN